MSDMDQQGFSIPETSFLTFSEIIPLFFTFVFIVWAIYTAVAAYHWFRYGRDSWLAAPAVFVHIFISGFLMLYATAGLH